jgi:hypothetical protein
MKSAIIKNTIFLSLCAVNLLLNSQLIFAQPVEIYNKRFYQFNRSGSTNADPYSVHADRYSNAYVVGGAIGLAVPPLWDATQPVGSSQFHLAIDPAALGDPAVFAARLRGYVAELKALPRQSGVDEIFVAGDLEWRSDERYAKGVGLLPGVVADLAAIAVERRLLRAWREVVDGVS